jgi:hypothetical protein
MMHTLDATLELTDAASFAAFAAVDAALSAVVGRELLTGQEARQIMGDVRASVDNVGEAGLIFDQGMSPYEHDSLIAGSKLVDVLLDTRCALAPTTDQ